MEKKIPIPKIPIKKKEVTKIPNSFPKKTVETLNLATEHDIAMDFAVKVYKKYDKMIKSVVLFGSTVKQDMQAGSDIYIIIILDDVTIAWDQELISISEPACISCFTVEPNKTTDLIILSY